RYASKLAGVFRIFGQHAEAPVRKFAAVAGVFRFDLNADALCDELRHVELQLLHLAEGERVRVRRHGDKAELKELKRAVVVDHVAHGSRVDETRFVEPGDLPGKRVDLSRRELAFGDELP